MNRRQPAPRKKKRKSLGGFTLLEVMIAMAILILALTALFGHEGVAIQMSDYSNKMSQAVMLGQGKMLDIEYKMLKDSIDIYDNCEEGDFRAEEMRRFSWKVCAYKIEMDDGAAEAITEQFMSMISGFMGGGDVSALGGLAAAAGGGGGNARLDRALGSITAAVGAIPFFLQQLEDKVRKVRLEITWADAVDERMLLFERYVTNLGVGDETQRALPPGLAPIPGQGGAQPGSQPQINPPGNGGSKSP
jgi:general secretion pathway protein I